MTRQSLAIPADLRLERATDERLEEYLGMIDAARAAGEDGEGYNLTVTSIVRRDAPEFLRRLDDLERGINLPEGWVPMSTRWLITADTAEDAVAASESPARGERWPRAEVGRQDRAGGGRIVGEARIRHALSPSLEIEGGHVGYFIHPHHRGRGYGNAILALALRELASLGIRRVLVTCNADNQRSRRVIERNGGIFDSYTISPRSGKQVMRFWIENGQAATDRNE